jgi:hypothetical protein
MRTSWLFAVLIRDASACLPGPNNSDSLIAVSFTAMNQPTFEWSFSLDAYRLSKLLQIAHLVEARALVLYAATNLLERDYRGICCQRSVHRAHCIPDGATRTPRFGSHKIRLLQSLVHLVDAVRQKLYAVQQKAEI